VGKLELYEPNQDKPEPDRNVVKVVESLYRISGMMPFREFL